jgi:uncharacterized protein YllA (UPF0747 family)
LKFEELPEIPEIWIDFIQSKLPFLPAPCEMHTLAARVGAVAGQAARRKNLFRLLTKGVTTDSVPLMESIERLRQSECFVVLANFSSSLFGGPVSQILKCLTAIKVCRELANRQVAAVPLCWMGSSVASSKWSVTLLDHRSELHRLQLEQSGPADSASGVPMVSGGVSALLSQIEELGRGAFDGEVLEILRAAFSSGATLSSACARLMANLMKEWGVIVLDAGAPALGPTLDEVLAPIRNQTEKILSLPRKRALESAEYPPAGNSPPDIFAQSLAMPVIARVVDPSEIYGCAKLFPVFHEAGLTGPMIWPQSSATILDSRSTRILERYDLSIRELYSGEEKIVNNIRNTMPSSAARKLEGMTMDVQIRIAELGALVAAGNKLAKTADSCKGKIVYQLEKLRQHFEAAVTRKEEVASRQIHKACNFLAPNRQVQERELAGIQIPLLYSLAGLRSVYERLDVFKLEHQLIRMD